MKPIPQQFQKSAKLNHLRRFDCSMPGKSFTKNLPNGSLLVICHLNNKSWKMMDPKKLILKDQFNGLYYSTLNQSPSIISEIILFFVQIYKKNNWFWDGVFSSCFEDSPEPKSGIRIFRFDDLCHPKVVERRFFWIWSPPLRNDHVIFAEENWVWGMFIYYIIFKLMYSIHIVHVNIRSGVRLDMEIVGFFHLRFYHLPVIEAKWSSDPKYRQDIPLGCPWYLVTGLYPLCK